MNFSHTSVHSHHTILISDVYQRYNIITSYFFLFFFALFIGSWLSYLLVWRKNSSLQVCLSFHCLLVNSTFPLVLKAASEQFQPTYEFLSGCFLCWIHFGAPCVSSPCLYLPSVWLRQKSWSPRSVLCVASVLGPVRDIA